MGELRWNENVPEPATGLDLVSAVFMEADILERIDDHIRRKRNTHGMDAPITLSADFDRLCDALEETETMSVKEAYEFLRDVGAKVDMDSQLKIWWLRSARDRLISAAERQGAAIDSAA